jgi:hypothetical protein
MASSRVETQITWSAASSLSISSASNSTSDAFTFDASDWAAAIQLSADNNGTPASGDTVDFYILWTSGDILGDTGSDYDTVEHAPRLCRLDTYATNSPGEDPARVTIPLDNIAALGGKIYAVNNSAGRAITVRARLVTQRGAVA